MVPAITHVDNSARVQTIDEKRAPRFYKIIKAFKARTGSPVVINTSFNVRGEPIVCTPGGCLSMLHEHQHGCVLVLENFKSCCKSDQPECPGSRSRGLPRRIRTGLEDKAAWRNMIEDRPEARMRATLRQFGWIALVGFSLDGAAGL